MRRFLPLTLLILLLVPQAQAQNSSVFTELDLDACETLSPVPRDSSDEAAEDAMDDAGWSGKCPGYGAIPIFASEGDLRFDIDAGVRNGRFETPWFFNLPHTTVEWRLDAQAQPFALIHRFWSDGLENRRSMLGVSKIGRPGEPGCMVALIAGDVPDANARATALADAIVDRIQCSDLVTYLIIE